MIPYKLRDYYHPGSKAGKYDESSYTEEAHIKNLASLGGVLEVYGDENERTPWLTTGIGVVAVRYSELKFDFSSVYLADDKMSYRQGLHFVRQDVTIHHEKGLRARTRVYPTLSRVVSLFTSADAAWSMMYPTLNEDPSEASFHLQEALGSPYELEPVSTEGLREMFPRQFALRHWVGVKPVKI